MIRSPALSIVSLLTVAAALFSPPTYAAEQADHEERIQIGMDQFKIPEETRELLFQLDRHYFPNRPAVILVNEPHALLTEQYRTFFAMKKLLQDNPEMLKDLIFLGEGIESGRSLDVQKLVNIDPIPSDGDIRALLRTFLIPEYVALSWSFGGSIPIYGIEDRSLYDMSRRAQIEQRINYDNWNSFVCRNKSMSAAIENAMSYHKYVILFAGSAHISGKNSAITRITSFGIPLSAVGRYERSHRSNNSNSDEKLGNISGCKIYYVENYLDDTQTGHTIFSTFGDQYSLSIEGKSDINRYQELMQSQAQGSVQNYIKSHLKEWIGGVTVSPDIDAAASVLQSLVNRRLQLASRDNRSSEATSPTYRTADTQGHPLGSMPSPGNLNSPPGRAANLSSLDSGDFAPTPNANATSPPPLPPKAANVPSSLPPPNVDVHPPPPLPPNVDCVFQTIMGTDSAARWARFPGEGGHGFHGKVGAPSEGVMEAGPTV